MKYYIQSFFSIVSLCLILFLTSITNKMHAQISNTSYFLRSSIYRHQLNPAYDAPKDYFALPIMGNISIGTSGNFGLNHFLYDAPTISAYETTTFMSSSVDANKFLSNLERNSRFGTNIDVQLLALGFHKWNGFNTVSLSLRSISQTSLPRELFAFMKLGQTDPMGTVYDIYNISAQSQTFAEIAFGRSKDINDELRVGFKVKGLIGLEYMNAQINHIRASLGDQEWTLESEGILETAVLGGQFDYADVDEDTPANHRTVDREINGVDIDSPKASGLGAAIDAGIIFQPNADWVFSASITDFGFIAWSDVNTAYQDPSNKYSFDGFHDFVLDENNVKEGDTSLGDQLDDTGDDFANVFKFYQDDDQVGHSKTKRLMATARLGAEYTIPFYRRLTTGLLVTHHFNEVYSVSEARLSANISPVEWVDGALSIGVGTFGTTMGWMLNFHPGVIDFFIGGDALLSKVNPQYIPLSDMNNQLSGGLSITF